MAHSAGTKPIRVDGPPRRRVAQQRDRSFFVELDGVVLATDTSQSAGVAPDGGPGTTAVPGLSMSAAEGSSAEPNAEEREPTCDDVGSKGKALCAEALESSPAALTRFKGSFSRKRGSGARSRQGS